MKMGWQTKKLGDLLEVQNGYAFNSKDYSESGHFLMRIGNVQNGYISTSDQKFIKLPADAALQRFSLSEGDILVSLTGNVGRVGVIKEEHLPAALNQRVARISIRKDSPATRELLLLFLHSDLFREELVKVGHGAAQQNISTKDIAEIEFPIPPFAEQKRIVGLLDEAFEGIATAKANAEKNLQNARALFESHLQSVFTQRGPAWVETTLDQISTNLDSKRVPITKNVRSSGEYPYYGASGIVDYVADYIFEGDNLLVSEDGANLLARSTPIAFSVSGKYWVNNHAHILHFENMATQRFAEFYLESIKLDDYITGAAQPKLNQKALNSIPIPIPKSVATQAKIVESVESLQEETQRLARLYERKLSALEALKKSLLHQAFTGQL